MLSPDIKNRIKVKEIFDHPWVRSFENISEINNSEKQQALQLNISNLAYNTNSTSENKFHLNKGSSEENHIKNKKSTSALVKINEAENEKKNTEHLSSSKSPINKILKQEKVLNNYELDCDDLIKSGSKPKLNLRDLKQNEKEKRIIDKINPNNDNDNNKNSLELNERLEKSKNYNLLEQNKEKNFIPQTANTEANMLSNNILDFDLNNFNTHNTMSDQVAELNNCEKSTKIVKKKKKILVAKSLLEQLGEGNEPSYISNYRDLKLVAIKKKKVLKLENELADNNQLDSNINNKLLEVKEKPRGSSIKKKSIYKNNAINRTATEKLPNELANKGVLKIQKIEDLKNLKYVGTEILKNKIPINNNYDINQNIYFSKNMNSEKIESNTETGYDLESFIIQQNSKKSKMKSFNYHSKSPNIKDKSYIPAYSSKTSSKNDNHKGSNEQFNTNNIENDNSINENFNKTSKFGINNNDEEANNNENSEGENNFAALTNFNLLNKNNNNNNLNKSIDKNFNDFSRDQIKDKINQKKNKSIMNAFNKTQNDILKYDNNQMNSSVIDVVFSKIGGKNKYKNKQKEREDGINFFLC